MKQRLIRYILPLALTLLCGLFLVHSNLKVDDTAPSTPAEALFQLNDNDQHANVGIFPLSSDKKLALEVAESEVQEEEVRHAVPSENAKTFGNFPAFLLLLTHFVWDFLYRSKKTVVATNTLEAILPYRLYIRFQVFRL